VKALKMIGIVFLVYVGIVVVFESLLGYFQPAAGTTLVISTTAEDGTTNDRVLSRLDSDGQIYVSANHWPRAWYNQALAHPEVEVTLDDKPGSYLAVPVTGEEQDRVNDEHRHGVMFRILTGFPPRYFVRLDPR